MAECRASVEALEARRLLSASVWVAGGVLEVVGTEGADWLRVSGGSVVRVESSGEVLGEFEGVERVRVSGLGGDDTLIVMSDVGLPAELVGGEGNDTLVAMGREAVVEGGGGTNAYWAGRKTKLTLVGLSEVERKRGVNRLPEVFSRVNVSAGPPPPLPASGPVVGSVLGDMGDSLERVWREVKKGVGKVERSVRETLREPRLTSVAAGTADFTGRPLFSEAGPSAEDVRQGMLNNCYLLVSLAGLAAADAGLIRGVVTELGDGTYAVRLMRGKTAVYHRVDADLPVVSPGGEVLAYAGLGRGESLWVALVEKAFALERGGSYARINRGGWMGDAMKALGVTARTVGVGSLGGAAGLAVWAGSRLAEGAVITLGTKGRLSGWGLVPGHAYLLEGVEVDEAGTVTGIRIRNPWGWDGPAGDGVHRVDAGVLLRAASAFSVALV